MKGQVMERGQRCEARGHGGGEGARGGSEDEKHGEGRKRKAARESERGSSRKKETKGSPSEWRKGTHPAPRTIESSNRWPWGPV